MPRGGARPGAGRKKGQTSRYISEQIRKHAMEDGGLTPLEVMVGQMRYLWSKGGTDNRMKAVEVVTAAAPYMHPRLQAVMAHTTHEAGDSLSELLKAIDGKTLGVESRGSPLEIEQPLFVSDEGRPLDAVPNELGTNGAARRPASSEAIGSLDSPPSFSYFFWISACLILASGPGPLLTAWTMRRSFSATRYVLSMTGCRSR